MTENKLDQIDFWAFTIAFAPKQPVLDAVERQLSKWWKTGIEACQGESSLAPLRLPKEYNPDSKIVALFELKSPSPAVLIESNLTERVRDIREAPDGSIWFLSVGRGTLYRMTPG